MNARALDPLPDRWSTSERVAFLTEASGILASLDYGGSLVALARHIVPKIADWWAIDLREKDGAIRRLVAYAPPPRDELARKLVGRYPHRLDVANGPMHVLQTGRAQTLIQVSGPVELALSSDPQHLETIRSLGLGTAICVPLTFRGTTLGVMTFVRNSVPFRPAHLALARTLSTRVGVTVAHGMMYEELENANRAKDEFLAMLGHELRNPLGALTSAVTLLQRPDLPQDVKTSAQAIIERQTGQLTKLVGDLLDVSRLTSGKITLEVSPTDLRALAERCLGTVRGAGKLKAHRLKLRGEPTLVVGDPTRLEQVLDNLLDNAVKFTPAGGRIEVRVESDGRQAILRVSDTGIGVAPELLSRMFDPFTQGPQSIDRQRGGLGLGLSIVQRLVVLHGGTVHATSEGEGNGTEVVVRLPLAPDRETPARAVEPSAPPDRRYRVLVVEDNADAREALRLLLEFAGHEVNVAGDGVSGLEAALTTRPQVALIDLGLPDIDGYSVARWIRKTLGHEAMGLVALTGYGQPRDRQRATEAGFDSFLVKPVDRAALAQVIEACAGMAR